MSGQPDTSAEAVEQLAALLDRMAERGDCAGPPICRWTAAALRALAEKRDDLQATFDQRWRADQRAIKAWQDAHPGNDLVWPSHDDLCLWLLAERDEAKAAAARAEEAASIAREAMMGAERDRDAALAARDEAIREMSRQARAAGAMEGQRDAARDRARRLHDLLSKLMADDMWIDDHPDVIAARAALGDAP